MFQSTVGRLPRDAGRLHGSRWQAPSCGLNVRVCGAVTSRPHLSRRGGILGNVIPNHGAGDSVKDRLLVSSRCTLPKRQKHSAGREASQDHRSPRLKAASSTFDNVIWFPRGSRCCEREVVGHRFDGHAASQVSNETGPANWRTLQDANLHVDVMLTAEEANAKVTKAKLGPRTPSPERPRRPMPRQLRRDAKSMTPRERSLSS